MKTITVKRWAYLSSLVSILLFNVSEVLAQIPQNIQVEGEVDEGWSLFFYLLAMVIVILGIFLVAKYLKRKK